MVGLASLIRDNVDETIACLVLAADSATNVGADAHENHGQVRGRVLVRVQTAEDRESTPAIDFLLEALELGAERGQHEVVLADLGAIKAELCNNLLVSAFGGALALAWGGDELTLEIVESRLDLNTLGGLEIIDPLLSLASKVLANPGVSNRRREALGEAMNGRDASRMTQRRRLDVAGSNGRHDE